MWDDLPPYILLAPIQSSKACCIHDSRLAANETDFVLYIHSSISSICEHVNCH